MLENSGSNRSSAIPGCVACAHWVTFLSSCEEGTPDSPGLVGEGVG